MADSIKNSTAIDPTSGTPTPPRLLVSVRNLSEARKCIKYPIAILDFKEPRNGALGAVSNDLLLCLIKDPSFVKTRTSNRPSFQLSFAAGELWEQVAAGTRLIDHWSPFVLETFHFAKIGLAGCLQLDHWQSDWEKYFAGDFSTSPVMVAYLDHEACGAPPLDACLALAQQHPRCKTLLLDTFYKTSNLFSWIDDAELARVTQIASESKLTCVVAGSVSIDSIDRVLEAAPDLVGVRGAVCSGDRESDIDGEKVAQLAERIRRGTVNDMTNRVP